MSCSDVLLSCHLPHAHRQHTLRQLQQASADQASADQRRRTNSSRSRLGGRFGWAPWLESSPSSSVPQVCATAVLSAHPLTPRRLPSTRGHSHEPCEHLPCSRRVLEAHLDSEEVREVPREWAGGAACPGRQRGHAAPQVPGMRGLFPLAVVASVLRSHLAPRQRRAPAAAPGADQRAVPRASAAPSQRGPRGGGIGGRVGRAAEERERRGSEERRRLKRHRCKECPHSPCTPSPPLSSPS